MSQVATDLAGKHCTIFSADAPACVLIQPTGTHELAGLAEEAAQIQQHAPCDVTLVSFPVTDWNRELSPWSARQAFGSGTFRRKRRRNAAVDSGGTAAGARSAENHAVCAGRLFSGGII
ncbi:MAG: hypothetical protein ACLUSL_09225 [Ruminococcus sp.]